MRDEVLNTFSKGVKKNVAKNKNWFNGDREKTANFYRIMDLELIMLKKLL